MRVLITGGAGFVGSNLGVGLAARHPDWELTALDNLHRRGSELNVDRLEAAGVRFARGDVRDPAALAEFGDIDALVECSAEPSALMGIGDDAAYGFHTNVSGAFNCLELARRSGARVVFLSTSRVYPYPALNALAVEETESRFVLAGAQEVPGASGEGISERFPLDGPRTLYGTTKLAAELVIGEYAAAHGVWAAIDRCGVIAGPWQMGKVDQGVFTYWLLHHHFGLPLRYIGYGGSGKQVRDLLHVEDLVGLIDEQLTQPERWSGETANVGGGRECSLSLRETTEICRELTGNEVAIDADPEPRAGDVRVYLSDCRALHSRTAWRPTRGPREILESTLDWIREAEDDVARLVARAR
ncbi:MAG: NAD-dependent epimerase/dehydratase family protein [Solirubrobacterales bacterium]